MNSDFKIHDFKIVPSKCEAGEARKKMTISSYDLKAFYNSRLGRAARRILNERINEIWPDCKSMRVMGCGYALPYLRDLEPETERIVALMPATAGAHHWPTPSSKQNLVALSEQAELPIETNSIDRVILVHDLEHCEFLDQNLAEIWRVMKSSGRLLVIVPNRSGFWARSDKTPFGQGRPFSTSQLCNLLRENKFTHERTEEALFMPPTAYPPFLKLANTFEKIGKTAFPIVAGVHMVEASKQLYARADKGSGSAIVTRGRRAFPKPAISRKLSSPRSFEE